MKKDLLSGTFLFLLPDHVDHDGRKHIRICEQPRRDLELPEQSHDCHCRGPAVLSLMQTRRDAETDPAEISVHFSDITGRRCRHACSLAIELKVREEHSHTFRGEPPIVGGVFVKFPREWDGDIDNTFFVQQSGDVFTKQEGVSAMLEDTQTEYGVEPPAAQHVVDVDEILGQVSHDIHPGTALHIDAKIVRLRKQIADVLGQTVPGADLQIGFRESDPMGFDKAQLIEVSHNSSPEAWSHPYWVLYQPDDGSQNPLGDTTTHLEPGRHTVDAKARDGRPELDFRELLADH